MSPQGTRLDLKSEHHSNPGSAGPAAHTCTLHCPRLCVLCQCTRLHSTLLPEARAEALRPANGQVQSRRFNPKASSLGHMPAPACSHLWSWLRSPLLCMNPPPLHLAAFQPTVSWGLEGVLCWRPLLNILAGYCHPWLGIWPAGSPERAVFWSSLTPSPNLCV